MFDYRAYDPLPTTRPVKLFVLFNKVINSIVVDIEQARAEVDADYSTITEVADMLLQKANVPFRVGHHFASAIVDFGRSRKIRLQEIRYEEAAKLYQENHQGSFPLNEEDWKKCADPAQMIFNRKGLGGPQLSEMKRMQISEMNSAEKALAWNLACRARLAQAKEDRVSAVKALIKNT
jgi:argininosuccinate lyase